MSFCYGLMSLLENDIILTFSLYSCIAVCYVHYYVSEWFNTIWLVGALIYAPAIRFTGRAVCSHVNLVGGCPYLRSCYHWYCLRVCTNRSVLLVVSQCLVSSNCLQGVASSCLSEWLCHTDRSNTRQGSIGGTHLTA